MPVVIEGFTVLVRNNTLQDKYPGGVNGFAGDCPNRTYCTDDALSAVSFMQLNDAREFVGTLGKHAIEGVSNGVARDVAIFGAASGLDGHTCEWLVFANYKDVPVAWADGTKPDKIVAPEGFSFEKRLEYMTLDEVRERCTFLRSEDSVDVYWDKVGQRELYVGRVASQSPEHSAQDNLHQLRHRSVLHEILRAAGRILNRGR